MDYSEEIENTVPEQRLSPRQFSKQLSNIPDNQTNEDLRIIGVKVKLCSNEAFSFPVENHSSQNAEIIPLANDSKRIFSRQITEAHHGVQKVRISCDVSSGDCKQERSEIGKVSPILELRLGSLGKEDKGFEVFIKSKHNDTEFPSEDGSFCSNSEYYDAEDHLSNFEKTNEGKEASPCNNSLYKTTLKVAPMNVTELSSMNTETEKEFESSSTQTTMVEITYPGKKQETTTQIDRKFNVSTSTENLASCRESIEIQTENIPKKHVSFQTETENITEEPQTETAAIFSIERTHDASTQIEEVAEGSTMTDFDTYLVDRTQESEKNTDTDDLPIVPLTVATIDKIESDAFSINMTDSSGKEYGHILSPNMDDKEYQELADPDGTVQSGTQLRFEESQKTLDSALKGEIPHSHSDKCSVSETTKEDAELMEPPFSLKLSEVDYRSVTLKENLNDSSKVEIIKNPASAFNQTEMIVAVRVQCPIKFEKAAVFRVPVVIQHFLNVFSLPLRKTLRVVINPIKISTEVSKLPDSEVESDMKNLISKSSLTEEHTKEAQTIGILNVMKGKSVVVSNIPHAAEDEHSQVDLCNNCYSTVQAVIEKKRQRHFSKKRVESYPRISDALNGKLKAKRSTTPRITPKSFDYFVRDAWVPKECNEDEVFSEKVEATDIIHINESNSDNDNLVESSDDMNLYLATEIVNDHLLNLRQLDEIIVQKAAQTLHRAWFEIVASKHADLEEVKFYIRYFEEFSNNLLKTLLHSTDSKGNNVLHFAFANNRFDLAEELLNNGYAAELLKKTNQTGNSPLMVCSISLPMTESDWSVVRRSFEMGDVNGKSLKSGQTPLMNAVSCGYETMVNMLLEVGANPNLQDKDGSTALMYAAEHGQDKCAKMLLSYKTCDPTIKDEDGQTACSIALSNGHKNITVLIHMQALENRQLSKHSLKRYVWTSNDPETESATVKPRSHSVHS